MAVSLELCVHGRDNLVKSALCRPVQRLFDMPPPCSPMEEYVNQHLSCPSYVTSAGFPGLGRARTQHGHGKKAKLRQSGFTATTQRPQRPAVFITVSLFLSFG